MTPDELRARVLAAVADDVAQDHLSQEWIERLLCVLGGNEVTA